MGVVAYGMLAIPLGIRHLGVVDPSDADDTAVPELVWAGAD